MKINRPKSVFRGARILMVANKPIEFELLDYWIFSVHGNKWLKNKGARILTGEGFILLTSYGFMGGMYHPPFDTLKICTSTDDMKLKLQR